MRYMGGKSRIAKNIAEILGGASTTLQYHGGKCRIASQISDVILNECKDNSILVSLFCGTCSIEAKAAPYFSKIICNDIHEYLIAMLQGVQNGYELPDCITQEQYKYIKEHKDEDKALTGFVGFGCSFGGKWFGGYARDKRQTNYADTSKRSLLKDIDRLKDKTTFTCLDYRDVVIPEGAIVYADPPYENTTGYNGIKFDNAAFWEYMREISKTHKVFISELSAPNDFKCIWQKPIKRILESNSNNRFETVEKLFVYDNK